MVKEYKTIPAFVQSVGSLEGEDKGIVDHLISVYGIVDKGQDMSHKGMFTKTLKERSDEIIVADNHNHDSVMDSLGVPIEFYEIGKHELPEKVLKKYPAATGGLCAKTQFLLDTPEGYGAFVRLKAGAISKFSFAYEAIQKDNERVGDKVVRHLREVKLHEYGPVLFAMNDAVVAISAKEEDEPELEGVALVIELNKKEFAEWKETKEVGLGRQFGKVREAFYNDYSRFEETIVTDEGESVTSYKWFSIVDVFEKYLVVESSGDLSYYQVGYDKSEEGTYTFAEKGDWVEGMLEFVAKAAEEKTDVLDEALEEDRLAVQAALELMGKNFGIDEAEPDEPPFTSKSQEELDEEWKMAQNELEATFNTWRQLS